MLTAAVVVAGVCCGAVIRQSGTKAGEDRGDFFCGVVGLAGCVWAMVRINQ